MVSEQNLILKNIELHLKDIAENLKLALGIKEVPVEPEKPKEPEKPVAKPE